MKHRTPYCVFFLLALLIGSTAHAFSLKDSTDKPHRLFAVAMARQGSLLTHQDFVLRGYHVGLDLKLGWQTDDHDKNLFDALFRYPNYGVGYYMGNMNGIILGTDTASASLGKPTAVYAFFGAPIYRGKSVVISYGINAGLSYNFNAYSAKENPFNILIGSKNNAYLEFSFDATFLLRGRSAFSAGVSFQHFSNGSYQKPNKGANLISGTLAYQLSRYKNREKSYAQPATAPEWKKSLEWNVVLGSGVRMLDTGFDLEHPYEGKRWPCITVSTALLRQTSLRRKWGGGIDLLYYEWGSYVNNYRATFKEMTKGMNLEDKSIALPSPAKVQQAMKSYEKLSAKNFTIGLYAAHELSYKRVSMITNLGFYPIPRVGDNPSKPIIYERVGARVALTNRLFVGVAIRAHGLKADFTEWSVGYALVKKKNSKSEIPT